MSTKRKFTIEPPLLGLAGQSVREVTLNIGSNPPGATGPAGNPNMQITSPNGSVWEITVSDEGVLGTIQIS